MQTIHQPPREFPYAYICCELRVKPFRETTDVYSLANKTVAKTFSPFMLQASYHLRFNFQTSAVGVAQMMVFLFVKTL